MSLAVPSRRLLMFGAAGQQPVWLPLAADGTPPLFAYNTTFNQGWYFGRSYNSVAGAIAAAGGTVSGATSAYGPYVDPGNTTYVSNGDFSSGTTGWSPFNSATIAAVGGECEMTGGGGANGAFTQQISGWEGQGGRLSCTARRGTSGETFNLCQGSVNAALGGSGLLSNNIASTSNVSAVVYAGGTANMWVGGRSQAAVGGGTSYWDNIALVKAAPMNGWLGPSGFSGVVEATTAASMSATEVIWHYGPGTAENFRVRLSLTSAYAASLEVRLANTVQASLTLGTFSPSTTYRIAFSLAMNAFYASVNGATAVEDTSGGWVGGTHLWIGRGASGNAFGGPISEAAFFMGAQGKPWVEATAAPSPFDQGWTEGDSYMGGAYGEVLWQKIATDASAEMVNTAIGGSTLDDVLARVLANVTTLGDRTVIIWDGSPNSYGSVANYLGIADQIIGAIPHRRIVFVRPVTVGPSPDGAVTAATLDVEAIGAGLIARGVGWFDPVTVCNSIIVSPTAQDLLDMSARVICASLLLDSVHLNGPALDAIAAEVVATLDANGWPP